MRMREAPFWSRMYVSVGRAAVMRVSSVIFPSLRGTLKSTRTSTRFFFRSMSRTVFLAIRMSPCTGDGNRHDFGAGIMGEFAKNIRESARAVSTADGGAARSCLRSGRGA